MDYQKHYLNLIFRAENRILSNNIYTEKHHIVPKCIESSKGNNYMVKFTPREHYIAHQLLYKIYKNTKHEYCLVFALKAMCNFKPNEKRNNRLYGWMRRNISEKISNMNKGKKRSEEQKRNHSLLMVGRKWTNEAKLNHSKIKKGKYHNNIPKINILEYTSLQNINLTLIEKYNLIEEDGVIKKKCKKCGGYIDVKNYDIDLTMKLSINSTCKICKNNKIKKIFIPKINIWEYTSLQNVDPKLIEKYDLIEENGIIKKKCSICKKYLCLVEFDKNQSMKIGLYNKCKKCNNHI